MGSRTCSKVIPPISGLKGTSVTGLLIAEGITSTSVVGTAVVGVTAVPEDVPVGPADVLSPLFPLSSKGGLIAGRSPPVAAGGTVGPTGTSEVDGFRIGTMGSALLGVCVPSGRVGGGASLGVPLSVGGVPGGGVPVGGVPGGAVIAAPAAPDPAGLGGFPMIAPEGPS